MTTEPDALDAFKADKVCQMFDVVPLAHGGSNKPFVQAEFDKLSDADRLEDARARLVTSRLPLPY
jgi:hypothetical protein